MDKKTEKKIEVKVKKKLEKKLEKEMEKEIEKEVKQEVKKMLHERIYHGTIGSARKFKKEFKDQIVVGVTAAFAFLIALSWRDPIQAFVNSIIASLGLVGKEIYIKFLSAIFITVIAVLMLMLVSRWKSKE